MSGDALTVGALLQQRAQSRAQHPFLVCDTDRITYAEADRRSAQLARGLIALGAGKGTHVGLLYPNGSDFVVGALAAARIGAPVVPISTFATVREMREQIVHSDIQILLSAASFRSHDYVQRLAQVVANQDFEANRPLFAHATPQLRHIEFSYSAGARRCIRDIEQLYRLAETIDLGRLRATEADVDGSDPLTIIYTSGSTSSPKGVVHTHAALLGHQHNLNEIRGLTAADKLFCISPFFWIGGFAFALLASLVAGSTLVCSNARNPGPMLDLLESEKPTCTNGFAAGVAHLAQHPSFAGRDLTSLRRGNLYPIMAPAARPADPELRHNMLGLTEAGGVLLISADESDQPEERRGSYGKPAPGFQTMVIEPDAADGGRIAVEVGRVGELCIRGPYLMQRYYQRSREESFDADGWFHTGDLVRTDAEGFFYFVGRRNTMIKVAGANVSTAEVENAIFQVTEGMTAYVVGLPDPQRGQVVAAVVVVPDGSTFDEAALRERLSGELSSYKIPTKLAALSRADVPWLPSGKVDRQRLRKFFDA